MLFQKCATQWEWIAIGDAMSGYRMVRTRLIYESVAVVANANGYELSPELLDRIQTCEAWVIKNDDTKRKKAPLQLPEPEEAVN
jgi:hypothetical protein